MIGKKVLLMPTPHINAQENDFAKVVLMPGDPVRAKWIAETFLDDIQLVNEVRGILGYTGYTKVNHKRISVMASGMGQPSIGIYSNELYTSYGVETIIRVGTAGSYQPDIKLFDILIAATASTDSNWQYQYRLNGTFSAGADFDVLREAYEVCKNRNLPFHVGNIFSADVFYDSDPNLWKRWAELNVLGVEMESYALFANAKALNKNAACILTISDSLVTHQETTAEERQTSFNEMMKLALETAIRL